MNCVPCSLQLALKAMVRAPQVSHGPLGSGGLRDGALERDACPLELNALRARRSLGRGEAYLRRVRRVTSISITHRADRDTGGDQAQCPEGFGGDETRLLPDRTHHTSCSATASPSRLIAVRVGRRSASSV
jgi:hypothetical protein